jgi:hypothetical protein
MARGLGVERAAADMDWAKARGLMQVIERIIARHNRGECRLDEETFKLFEIAKRIKRARSDREFLEAVRQLETPRG